MKLFKDNANRDWSVVVNYSAKVRVQAKTGLDLFDASVFEKLGDNPSLLLEVLAAVCDEQIRKLGLTLEQFADAICGDAIEAASDALIEELIAFFPKRRREMLTKLLGAAKAAQDKAAAQLDQALASGKFEAILEQSLNEPSGSSPASSESTPAPSPSASST